MWLLQLPLPLFAGQLVAAKERGSRQMMALQGLGDGPYLVATWLWQMGMYCAFLVVLLASGWALGLKAFTLNDLGVQVSPCEGGNECPAAIAFLVARHESICSKPTCHACNEGVNCCSLSPLS
jgi:hypothetical protein